MSRSGYIEDYDYQESPLNLYRGVVNSAIKGKRGQAFAISTALAAEIMFENDDQASYRANESVAPEKRWRHMRRWLESKLIAPKEMT